MSMSDDNSLTPERPSQPQLSLTQPFPMSQSLGHFIQQQIPQRPPQPAPLMQPSMQILTPEDQARRQEQQRIGDRIRSTVQPRPSPVEPQYQPPPWREPYSPVQSRDSGAIGGPWFPVEASRNYPGAYPGPGMPDFREAIGIIGGSGRQYGMAMGGAAPFYGRASQMAMQYAPFLDAISGGKFSKSFLAARQGQLKLVEDQIMLNTEMGLAKHQQELMAYGRVFDGFNHHAFSKDDVKNTEEATRQLEELAAQDPIADGILRNQGIKSLEDYLKRQDNLFRNTYAAYTSMKKSKDASGAPDISGTGSATGPEAIDTRHPTEKVADAEGKPIAPSEKTATQDLAQEQAKADADLKKRYNLNDTGLEMAKDHYKGTGDKKEEGKLDPNQYQQMLGASSDIKNKVARALDNTSMSPEQKYSEIAKYDQDQANKLRDMASYKLDPKGFSVRNDGRGNLEERAIRFSNGKYKPAMFDQISKLLTKSGPQLDAAARLDNAGNVLLAINNKFSEGERIPARFYDMMIANNYSGDPKWREFGQAMVAYTQAVSASESGLGRPYATVVNQMLRHAGGVMSPAMVRAMVKVDNQVGYGQAQETNSRYKGYTGGTEDIPGWNKDVDAAMRAKSAMDVDTGEMPIWAPPKIRALSRTPSDKDRPGYKRDERSPLTEPQIKRMQDIVNNPDKPQELRDRAARMLLEGGITP